MSADELATTQTGARERTPRGRTEFEPIQCLVPLHQQLFHLLLDFKRPTGEGGVLRDPLVYIAQALQRPPRNPCVHTAPKPTDTARQRTAPANTYHPRTRRVLTGTVLADGYLGRGTLS